MESKLFQAARRGDLDALRDDSVREDTSILQKLLTFRADTPLHLASMYGHADFVMEYINLSSISTQQLCQLNEDGYSPLHLDSANGHVEIVKYQLEFGRQKNAVEELCMKKDRDGRAALHCAVVTGKVDLIEMIFVDCPSAAMEVTVHNQSVLHLAVKHHQFEALKFLIEKLGSEAAVLLNQGDREGNNVLHLATARRQLQTVEYLVKQPGVDANAENSYGLRALDMMLACALNSNDMYVEEAIRTAGGTRSQKETGNSRAAVMPHNNHSNNNHIPRSVSQDEDNNNNNNNNNNASVNAVRNGVIVMASLIITLTFQVALTPPGGLWQDWGPNADSPTPRHKPGESIFYDLHRGKYDLVVFFNLNAFIASVITIFIMLRRTAQILRNGRLRLPMEALSMLAPLTLLLWEFLLITIFTANKLNRRPVVIVTLVIWSGIFFIFSFIYVRRLHRIISGNLSSENSSA